MEVEITVYDDGRIVETGSDLDRMAGDTSTRLSNGTLSLRSNNCNYVRVSYVKRSGVSVNLKLGWFSGDAGRVSGTKRGVAAGETVSQTWEQVRVPGGVVGYMEVEGQGRFQTPSVGCR
ncbi:hypothetical protein AB0F97_01250 [Nocardiopsis alba]|uniref:hypothetical protein n=1 Tax=Nocardiopsis alba TaxID=53437 RepID=UPI0033DEF537